MAYSASGWGLACAGEQLLQLWVVVVLQLSFRNNAGWLQQKAPILIFLHHETLIAVAWDNHPATAVCLDHDCHALPSLHPGYHIPSSHCGQVGYAFSGFYLDVVSGAHISTPHWTHNNAASNTSPSCNYSISGGTNVTLNY
jgi:hypothetical protein